MKTMIPLLLSLRVLSGCVDTPTTPEVSLHSEEKMVIELVGDVWLIETIEGADVIEGSQPSLMFHDEGRLSGNAGCNLLAGQYQQSVGEPVFNPLGVTRKLCARPLMDQESQLLSSLRKVASMQIDDAGLLLLLEDDKTILATASRKPE